MRDRKDMDTYIESKVEEFKKLPAEPSVFTGHDVLIKWVETALTQTAEKARVEAIRDVKSVGRRASGGYPPTQQGKIQRSRAFGFNEGASAALEALKANTTKN